MTDFWARRKAAVADEAREEVLTNEARLRDTQEAELAEKSDEEILAELDLPDPDSLVAGDDVKPFLTEAVPQRIKTRVLRRLWRLNPVLANVDGLVDYGEDYTDAATVVENLQTSYQVGKGMLAHLEELARQAEEAGEESSTATNSDASHEDVPEPDVETLEMAEEEAAPVPDLAPLPLEPEHLEDTQTAFRAPRMRFTFQEQAPL